MAEPTAITALIQSVRASTATLLEEIAAGVRSDADIAAASAHPDWTNGHVLTHLARSADAIAATMSGTLRDEVVPLYPDGRTRDIDEGAGRPALEVVTDVRAAAERLDRVIGAVHEADAWERRADRGWTNEDLLLTRWCEVELHRVDLGLATSDDWPDSFVERQLAQWPQERRCPQ